MRRPLLALTAALTLTACIEVDMNIEVLGQDEARVSGHLQMDRQMFEMSGRDASFCTEEEGGTLVLTDLHARCEFSKQGTFAEILTPPDGAPSPDEPQGELTWLDTNRVRAFFPMGAFNEGTADMGEDPQMEAMMRQMLAGLSITLRVTGAEIESSTGTISDDGTQAVMTLGVEDVFDKARGPLPDFDTVVKY